MVEYHKYILWNIFFGEQGIYGKSHTMFEFSPQKFGGKIRIPPTLTVGKGGGLHQRLGPEYISYCSPIRGFLAGFKQVLPSSFQISMVNGEQTCYTLWIQVAARNALRVQFGG